ncbi:MAG TPA: antirestriction protein [Halieaceae bacterium]|mgnify:CR=1 FL=1|nr:antirestriction protein [Halieaceae bacterium]|tara:strand:+ start:46 stop:483 length:438 start_codon:yes stop_codon:yes gene_type:complete
MTQDITSITRTLIPANERTNVAHQLFGSAFLRLETTVYHLADSMAAEYNGGSWDFYLLSAGDRGQAFYMAPQREDDQPFTVACPNFWQGTLSADALGITACLCAYSHLSFTQHSAAQRFAAEFHQLRDLMLTGHPEAMNIIGAID